MPPQTFTAADRLGLTKQVCYSCNARNPERAESCRKCGNGNLRPRITDLQKNRS